MSKGRVKVSKETPAENIFELCPDHHKWNRELSCHGAPVAFGVWLHKHFPEKAEVVDKHKYESITRKAELPWTFREKYEELQKL